VDEVPGGAQGGTMELDMSAEEVVNQ